MIIEKWENLRDFLRSCCLYIISVCSFCFSVQNILTPTMWLISKIFSLDSLCWGIPQQPNWTSPTVIDFPLGLLRKGREVAMISIPTAATSFKVSNGYCTKQQLQEADCNVMVGKFGWGKSKQPRSIWQEHSFASRLRHWLALSNTQWALLWKHSASERHRLLASPALFKIKH